MRSVSDGDYSLEESAAAAICSERIVSLCEVAEANSKRTGGAVRGTESCVKCRERTGRDQCGFIGILFRLCRMMDDAAEKDHDFSQCLWEGKSQGTLTDEEQERFNDFKTKNFEVVSAEDSDTYDFTTFWIVC